MPSRILLLYKSIGAGLARAAEAVDLALRHLDPSAIVHRVDIMQLDFARRQRRAANNGVKLVEQAPHRVAYLYEQADRPSSERHYSLSEHFRIWRGDLRRRWGNYRLSRSLAPLLQAESWDLVVNIDASSGGIIALLKRQGKLQAPQFLVTTDFMTHRSSYAKCYEHYFTATDEGAAYLKALGVKKKRIGVTGIPIHPDFSQVKERATCLASQRLAGDRPIVLQIAAGFGSSTTTMPAAAQAFNAILTAKTPLDIVVVTGHNQNLKQQLQQIVSQSGEYHRTRILGFTERIDELMRVAEVVVCKPGGLTSAEVLASGAGMVIVNPRPGMEAQNSDFLLENGAAVKCHHLETLPYLLEQLLSDSERLAQMRHNARRLGRPQAAFEIARYILDWVAAKKGHGKAQT